MSVEQKNVILAFVDEHQQGTIIIIKLDKRFDSTIDMLNYYYLAYEKTEKKGER